ncbi:MAG: hypothetical protein ACYSTI_13600, partial [Planctomycetota bacterium]
MHVKIRYILLFAGVLAMAALYLVMDFKSVPDADATGGAFTDTKHGGGTVDGVSHPGVDRSVNPANAPFYSSDSEAGEYNPGECAHCHEAHSSFGELEPPPDTPAGPT